MGGLHGNWTQRNGTVFVTLERALLLTKTSLRDVNTVLNSVARNTFKLNLMIGHLIRLQNVIMFETGPKKRIRFHTFVEIKIK